MPRVRRYQHGSLFKRGTRKKVWVARWWEEATRPDGSIEKTRRSEVLGSVADIPTRREAERLLNERLRHVNSSEYRPLSNCTFREFVRDVWLPSVLPTVKFSTQKHYQYAVNIHLLPEFGDMPLRVITRDRVQNFVFAKSSTLSWKTVKHLRTVLGMVMTAAEFRDLISENPVRKTRLPRRLQQDERPAISPEQIGNLLEKLPEPSRSLAALLALTGLRIGELLALRWRDVDLETGFLRVRQTVYEGHFDEPKSRRSRRSIPITPCSVAILEKRKPTAADPEALVFATRRGTPFSRRNLLRRQLAPVATEIGLKGASWHWLRHAYATMLDAVGTPIGTTQAMLGHSSSDITRDVYLHAIPADARRAAEKVEGLIIGPKWTQVLENEKFASDLIQ